MKKLFATLCLFAVVGLVGCGQVSYKDRKRTLDSLQGKKISEAKLQNNHTLVLRFEDGTMTVVETANDEKLYINEEGD